MSALQNTRRIRSAGSFGPPRAKSPGPTRRVLKPILHQIEKPRPQPSRVSVTNNPPLIGFQSKIQKVNAGVRNGPKLG